MHWQLTAAVAAHPIVSHGKHKGMRSYWDRYLGLSRSGKRLCKYDTAAILDAAKRQSNTRYDAFVIASARDARPQQVGGDKDRESSSALDTPREGLSCRGCTL